MKHSFRMILQMMIAFDQLVNTLIYIRGDGIGMADETISARLFRCHIQGHIGAFWFKVVDAIFFWQDNHCFHAWREEWDRGQYPSHYREGKNLADKKKPP